MKTKKWRLGYALQICYSNLKIKRNFNLYPFNTIT
jgi:hypothetical protein